MGPAAPQTSSRHLAASPWRSSHLWYLPVLAVAMGLMMLRVLLMARLLPVERFGEYNAGLLVSTTFNMLSCLGLLSVLQRDMPIMASRGRVRRPLLLVAQAALVACVCAGLALLVPLASVGAAGLAPGALAVAIVHGLSQQVFLVATVESRSLGDPVRYALQNLVRAVAVILLSGSVALMTGSAALALATEATTSLLLAAGIFVRIAQSHSLRLRLIVLAAWRALPRANWRSAWVFLGVSLAASAVAYADRWFAASLLPSQAFAQYAFAGIVVLIAQSVQAMINASVYPALARCYALEGTAATFLLAARVSVGLLAVSLALAIPAYFSAGWAVRHWYPAYAPALSIIWIVLGIAVLRVSDFWTSFLTVVGSERLLLAVQVLLGALVCIAWFAWISGTGAAVTIADVAWLALLLALSLQAGAVVAATGVYARKVSA